MTVTENSCFKEKYPELMERIDPPAAEKGKYKQPILMIFQTIFITLITIPLIIWSIIEELFLTKKKSLEGKTVLVTGSGRGLGQGFAIKFAQLGCKVICVDIDEVINKETVDMINEKYPGKAKGYICNVGLSHQIRTLKEDVKRDFGDIDILFHNAGLVASASITEFDDAYLHGLITVNLTSHFFMLREFLPQMLKRNEGHIVAVSSMSGFFGMANGSMYSATKHGIIGLMESLHYELNENPKNNIKTSVICPYFVNTSALYKKFWDMRIPELSIEEVVNVAVAGIRKNKRVITIPTFWYFLLHFFKLLPDRLNLLIQQTFYIKLLLPPKSFQQSTPLFKLLINSMRNIDLGFEELEKNKAA